MKHWGQEIFITRRGLIACAAGLIVARAAHAALPLTPPQTAGPFYPAVKPADTDSDLTRIAGGSGQAQGQVIEVAGKVLSVKGHPLAGSVIELWQADANGRYAHPHDPGPGRDRGFQGYGAVRTDTGGGYRFRTIKPRYYGAGAGLRTPHIHFRVVTDGGRLELVTQMYFPGEPMNARDFLFARLPGDPARAAATARGPDGSPPRYSFDFVLA